MKPTPPSDEEQYWDEVSDQEDADSDTNIQGTLFGSKPSSLVRLAGSDRFLIVDGPNAGEVSDNGDGQRVTADSAPRLRTRDEALDENVPIFLTHRGGQYHKHLPHVLARLHQAEGSNISLGAILRIPGQTASVNRDFFGKCSTAAIRIADPFCYSADKSCLRLPKNEFSQRTLEHAPYLEDVSSSDLAERVLDAQRESGANLLLTTGRALDTGNSDESIKGLFEDAEKCLALLDSGERLALNLTISSRWLAAENLRERLLNELLDREEHEIWFVRVQWRAQLSYAQLSDESLLAGYKRLAELAMDEGRILLLPQTGITGWLMLAFGARGYGVGVSATDQAFKEPSFGRKKGSTRRERYYERQLLHTVERGVHDVLADEPDYVGCECTYCQELSSSPAWSHELAGLHSLYSSGCLAGEIQRDIDRGGQRAAIRRAVRSAQRFAAGKDLVKANAPQHLPAWDRLL
jgi:hypothetical protein